MLIHRSSSLVLTNITLTNIPLNKSGGQSLVRRSLVVDSSSSNKPDEESPQFNEKLIERIRKSQLFDQSYSGVWQQSSRPNAKQNARQQPAISLPADLQKYLPSVSKIISETMTEENAKVLEIWKAKMIKKLGWAGFQKYQNETLSRGKRLHKNIEYKLKQQEENIKLDEDLDGYWTSIKPILAEVNEVHLIEEKLSHPHLLYKGIVDCVAKLNKTTTVVDWKTSEKVKDTLAKLYDAPVQTVAYLGALNQSPDLLKFEIDKVAVVVAYGDGRVANYHQLKRPDCERFWSTWTKKVEQYWIKTLSGSPADPGLIAHLDDLLTASDDKNKKVYRLAGLKGVSKEKTNAGSKGGSKEKTIVDSLGDKENSSRVGLTNGKQLSDQPNRNLKTKDELIRLIQERREE